MTVGPLLSEKDGKEDYITFLASQNIPKVFFSISRWRCQHIAEIKETTMATFLNPFDI